MFGLRSGAPSRPIDRLGALEAGTRLLLDGGCVATGSAAVAFRPRGPAGEQPVRLDLPGQLPAGITAAEPTADEYGYSWLELSGSPEHAADLVAALVASASALVEATEPLCALMSFRGPGGRLFAIVFRFDSGTFYPFLPDDEADDGVRARDNLAELRLRDALDPTLPMERDQRRWGALWDAPGLRSPRLG